MYHRVYLAHNSELLSYCLIFKRFIQQWYELRQVPVSISNHGICIFRNANQSATCHVSVAKYWQTCHMSRICCEILQDKLLIGCSELMRIGRNCHLVVVVRLGLVRGWRGIVGLVLASFEIDRFFPSSPNQLLFFKMYFMCSETLADLHYSIKHAAANLRRCGKNEFTGRKEFHFKVWKCKNFLSSMHLTALTNQSFCSNCMVHIDG